MNLVYVDESGNTGLNLKDTQQPVFILAALIVPEYAWFTLERDFFRMARDFFGTDLAYPFEIHATDLKSGRRLCKDLPLERRLSFRDQMLQLVDIAAYHIRKYEESKSGFRVNPLDAQTFGNLRKLISTGVGSDLIDVVEWVKSYFAK